MWELPAGSGYRGQAGAVTETRVAVTESLPVPVMGSRYGQPVPVTAITQQKQAATRGDVNFEAIRRG